MQFSNIKKTQKLTIYGKFNNVNNIKKGFKKHLRAEIIKTYTHIAIVPECL